MHARANHLLLLFVCLRLQPSPELHACSSFPGTVPRPRAPALGIPPPEAEPQVQLSRACMLENLTQRSGEVAKVMRFESR